MTVLSIDADLMISLVILQPSASSDTRLEVSENYQNINKVTTRHELFITVGPTVI